MSTFINVEMDKIAKMGVFNIKHYKWLSMVMNG